MNIYRVKNPEEGIEFAYNLLLNLFEKADNFKICISGGTTPVPLYKKLNEFCISNPTEVAKIKVCWTDERNVPYDSSRSNYGTAKKVFPFIEKLVHSPITTGNIIEELPKKYLESLTHNGFVVDYEFIADLSILGMGADGHTASIFPNTKIKFANKFVAISAPINIPEDRITLLPAAINNSKAILALIFGNSKQFALKECLSNNVKYPFTSVIQNATIITDQDV
jgi:6-phosphogluconolactonase